MLQIVQTRTLSVLVKLCVIEFHADFHRVCSEFYVLLIVAVISRNVVY